MEIRVEQQGDLILWAAISEDLPRQGCLSGTPLVDHFLQSGVHSLSLAPRDESSKGLALTPARWAPRHERLNLHGVTQVARKAPSVPTPAGIRLNRPLHACEQCTGVWVAIPES